jgi:hypothetical protein
MLLANSKFWDSLDNYGILNDVAVIPSPPSSDWESPVTASTYDYLSAISPTLTADSSMDRYTVASETTQIDSDVD